MDNPTLDLFDEGMLFDVLNRLNEAGLTPEIAGYDAEDRPFMAWLNESGGDDVVEQAVVLRYPNHPGTDEMDCTRREPVEMNPWESNYPLNVLTPRNARLVKEFGGF